MPESIEESKGVVASGHMRVLRADWTPRRSR